MAKIKYDVREVEPSRDFDTPIPVGVYKLVVSNAVKKPSKKGDDMLEIELEVPKGEHKGRKVWEYIVLNEESEWKIRQLIDALAAPLKGTLDTDKLMGQTILTKVKHEPWERDNDEGETELTVMSKVGSFLKPKAEEEESEEEEGEEAEAEEGAEEEDDGTLTMEYLNGLDRTELKAFIKENEATTKVLKKDSDDDIRAKLAEEFGVEEAAEEEPEEEPEEDAEVEEEAEPEAEEDDGELTWEYLTGLDRTELKTFIKENEAETKVLKKDSDDDVRRKIAAEWELEIPEEGEEEAAEEEAEEEDAGYAEWTMPDLKKELKARDLKTAGTKKALVARLEKDDTKGSGGKKKDEPF